jgi:hypothetical protein
MSAGDLDHYLRILAGADPSGRLIEIRSKIPAGPPAGAMRQTFTPATRPQHAAKTITRLAARTDVYVGVLLRRRRGGGRDACEHSHLAFVEIDRADGAQRLARYRCPPTMIIASGGSPGHAHAYWQLHEPIGLDELETANRRLAIRLGGDLASVDAARILRPPTSRNWKNTPPNRVELLELHPDRRYTVAELTAGLADSSPAPRAAPAAARASTSDLDRQLLAIPAAAYVPALTGRQPNRAGKIACPFHDDHTPSLQLYQHNWYCFGACRTGGSIYDFGALLYGLGTRGHDFLMLRRRLAEDLHLTAPRTAALPAAAAARAASAVRVRGR